MDKRGGRGNFSFKKRHVKSGQTACYNARDLRMALIRNCNKISVVIAEILVAIKVQKKRIAAKVINWLHDAAKNYEQAKEVLKLVAP